LLGTLPGLPKRGQCFPLGAISSGKIRRMQPCNDSTCQRRFLIRRRACSTRFRVARVSRLFGNSDTTAKQHGWQVRNEHLLQNDPEFESSRFGIRLRRSVRNCFCFYSKSIGLTPHLAGRLDAVLEHVNSLCNAFQSRLFLLCFPDPAAILFAMGIPQLFEAREESFFLHQR